MIIDTSQVPLKIFPNIEDNNFCSTSLYKLMRETYNIFPHYANLNIEPIISTPLIRDRFELPEAQALLRSSGIVLTKSNMEIERIEIIYSPNFKFKLSKYI